MDIISAAIEDNQYFPLLCATVFTSQAIALGFFSFYSTDQFRKKHNTIYGFRVFLVFAALAELYVLMDIRLKLGDLRQIEPWQSLITDRVFRSVLLFVAEDFFLFWTFRIASRFTRQPSRREVVPAASESPPKGSKSKKKKKKKPMTSKTTSKVSDKVLHDGDENTFAPTFPLLLVTESGLNENLFAAVYGLVSLMLCIVFVWPHPVSILIWVIVRIVEAFDVQVWNLFEQEYSGEWRPSYFIPYWSTKLHRQVDYSLFLFLSLVYLHVGLGGLMMFPLQCFLFYMNIMAAILDHQKLPNLYLSVVQISALVILLNFGYFSELMWNQVS